MRAPKQGVGRHVLNTMADLILRVFGLRRHSSISVVRAPRTTVSGGGARDGYGVVAPRPTLCAGDRWSRGIPGTRALAQVATHCAPSAAP